MIDLFNHLLISVPNLSQTEITFYGGIGYFAFCIMGILALIGGLTIVNIIKKICYNLLEKRMKEEK